MFRTPISQGETAAITAAVQAGESYRAIAEKLGRSESAIVRLATRLGLRECRHKSTAALSDGLQEQIRRLVERGNSFTATAKVVGCDPKTVAKIARRAGLDTTRKFGGSQDMSRTLRGRIEAMAGSTATNARLAEMLGCTIADIERVRAERRREAKERARKAYQKRVVMPGYEEDLLGQVLAHHPRPQSVTGSLIGRPVMIGKALIEDLAA